MALVYVLCVEVDVFTCVYCFVRGVFMCSLSLDLVICICSKFVVFIVLLWFLLILYCFVGFGLFEVDVYLMRVLGGLLG